jgi:hypothetical protein
MSEWLQGFVIGYAWASLIYLINILVRSKK